MRRERSNAGADERPSPEKQYQDFAKDNADWDRKVKKSIKKIGKAAQRAGRTRDAGGH